MNKWGQMKHSHERFQIKFVLTPLDLSYIRFINLKWQNCIKRSASFLLIVIGIFLYTTQSHADDYIRDLHPYADNGAVPYEHAEDPQVCDLYLQNLRYFVKRKLPLSCGQPVAPTLANIIKPVEWENLDPDQYPELFKELVRANHYMDAPDAPGDKSKLSDEKIYKDEREEVKKGIKVFRRANLTLKGYLILEHDKYGNRIPPQNESNFQIVQLGFDVITLKNSPYPLLDCANHKNRSMNPSQRVFKLQSYFVTNDLMKIYTGIGDYSGGVTDFFVINNKLYAEDFDEYGNVEISQLSSTKKYGIGFDSVCLYHFKHR